jgi:hypothetical protein
MRGMTIAAALVAGTAVHASNNPDQEAIDACIDGLIAEGAQGGEVLGSSFSEAGTEVMLLTGGEVWRCIAYRDGALGLLEVVEGADPEAIRGAMSIADAQEQVQFAAGTSGAEITRAFAAGEARQFLLGAQAGQTLSVKVAPQGGAAYYVIRNPDGSILLGGTDAGTPYSGELGQSGDHVVEVISQESAPQDIALTFGIE